MKIEYRVGVATSSGSSFFVVVNVDFEMKFVRCRDSYEVAEKVSSLTLARKLPVHPRNAQGVQIAE